MAVAMPAKYGNTPASNSLFGSREEQISENLARKLAKKSNQQVFVSCSIPYDQQVSLMIEKRLAQELGKGS